MAARRHCLVRHAFFFAPWMFLKLTGVLPLSISRLLGSSLAMLAYRLVPRLRRIGFENIERAYGDTLDIRTKERILRDSVKNLGLVTAEFSSVPRLMARRGTGLFSVEGGEWVDFQRGGHIFIGAHLGNWEWMLPAGALQGLRLIVVVREFDDSRTHLLVDRMRCAGGVVTIPKNKSMGELARRLQEGWSVGLLADQNPRDNAVPVCFFGHRTWATIGPALLALRTGAPIHPTAMFRKPDGTYVLRFFPALPLAGTGNRTADILENTQRCQNALEGMIREHPEQWLWFHRRWRPRERLEREWSERMSRERQAGQPSHDRIQGECDA